MPAVETSPRLVERAVGADAESGDAPLPAVARVEEPLRAVPREVCRARAAGGGAARRERAGREIQRQDRDRAGRAADVDRRLAGGAGRAAACRSRRHRRPAPRRRRCPRSPRPRRLARPRRRFHRSRRQRRRRFHRSRRQHRRHPHPRSRRRCPRSRRRCPRSPRPCHRCPRSRSRRFHRRRRPRRRCRSSRRRSNVAPISDHDRTERRQPAASTRELERCSTTPNTPGSLTPAPSAHSRHLRREGHTLDIIRRWRSSALQHGRALALLVALTMPARIAHGWGSGAAPAPAPAPAPPLPAARARAAPAPAPARARRRGQRGRRADAARGRRALHARARALLRP